MQLTLTSTKMGLTWYACWGAITPLVQPPPCILKLQVWLYLSQQDNEEDWVVSEEIPLTTASITKYENGTNNLRLLVTKIMFFINTCI